MKTKEYVPKAFPEKCVLLGGGQFANQFIIVNVLNVKEVASPLHGEKNKIVLQATIETRKWNDEVELFSPYLISYYLCPLAKKYLDAPLDTYLAGFDGTAQGQYTKHILRIN